MDHEIIDMHSHLGDICFPNGGELIAKKGVKKKIVLDVVTLSEIFLHPFTQGLDYESWVYKQNIKASMERNFTGTLENFRKSMDEAGVAQSVALPVPPCVTFADLKNAAEKDPGIIPFSGIDFTREYDIAAELAKDVAAGAKGIKLHPVLQREKLASKKTYDAIEAFAVFELPVLIHTGICHYYPLEKDARRQEPFFADIPHVQELVKAFPNVKFIAGHAGLSQARQAIDLLAGFKNVWVECSFLNPGLVREMIKAFGPERVLFGSDWPWGNRKPAIIIIKSACRNDKALERRIFCDNAAELMSFSL